MIHRTKTINSKCIVILLVAIMFLSCFIPSIAYAEEQNVSKDEARYLAIACVWDLQSSGQSFGGEIYFSDVFTLYDENLNPSAYVANFVDKNGAANGYVVIGVTSDYPEIIEFSDKGRSPYEEQYMCVDNDCEDKVYSFYEGNVTPLCIDKKERI